MLKQIAALRRGAVAAKAKQYVLDMTKESDRLEAAEEVMAEMAQSKPEMGYVKRAIAAIRAFLRKNVPGFQKLALTDDDIIAQYILPARAFVENGGKLGADRLTFVPAMSRDEGEGNENETRSGQDGFWEAFDRGDFTGAGRGISGPQFIHAIRGVFGKKGIQGRERVDQFNERGPLSEIIWPDR